METPNSNNGGSGLDVSPAAATIPASSVPSAAISPATSSVETPKAPAAAAASQGVNSPQPSSSTPVASVNASPATGVASPGGVVPNSGNTQGRSGNSSSSNAARTNLRGLNKPKCSVCGNVARSRCPFQACKSCCVKAKNPCQIHVLKQSSGLSEKSPSHSAAFEQPRSAISGNSFAPSPSSRPLASPVLHNLPGTSVQTKTKRPLSRKEILQINNWRFKRLKDFEDGKIEAEDEAFERYMNNASLLENIFCSTKVPFSTVPIDGSTATGAESPDDADDSGDDGIVDGIKLRLKSNIEKTQVHKERLRGITEKGFHKLKCGEYENTDDMANASDIVDRDRLKKLSLTNTLLDKLGKASSHDDVNACSNMFRQITGKNVTDFVTNKNSTFVGVHAPPCDKVEATDKLTDRDAEQGHTCKPFSLLYRKGWAKVEITDEIREDIIRIDSSFTDVLEL